MKRDLTSVVYFRYKRNVVKRFMGIALADGLKLVCVDALVSVLPKMWSTPTYIAYRNGWIEKPKINGSISFF